MADTVLGKVCLASFAVNSGWRHSFGVQAGFIGENDSTPILELHIMCPDQPLGFVEVTYEGFDTRDVGFKLGQACHAADSVGGILKGDFLQQCPPKS